MENNLCINCYERPIFNKSRGLCSPCYQWMRCIGLIKVLSPIERLIQKHGNEFLQDFDLLSTKHFWTLSDIGKKYRFSREYARQIYNQLFDPPYREIKKQLTEERNSQLNQMACAYDPNYKVASYKNSSLKKGAEIELLVFNKCREIGLLVKSPIVKSYDLIINNYKVDIKSAYRASTKPKKSHVNYFHFSITPAQFDICEFFICYPVPKKIFYIIPRTIINSRSIYIRENDGYQHPTMPYLTRNNTNHQEYKEAWHLLK